MRILGNIGNIYIHANDILQARPKPNGEWYNFATLELEYEVSIAAEMVNRGSYRADFRITRQGEIVYEAKPEMKPLALRVSAILWWYNPHNIYMPNIDAYDEYARTIVTDEKDIKNCIRNEINQEPNHGG